VVEPVIRDLLEFRRIGVVCRQVEQLTVPVATWRAAMRHAGRRDRARTHTFLVPPTLGDGEDQRDQRVYAVRIDPPPDPAVQRRGVVWWRAVDEFTVPVPSWRAAMRGIARHERVRIHTFLVPVTRTDPAQPPQQLVYAVWADAAPEPDTPITVTPPRPHPQHRPVTVLADYVARRAHHTRPATPRSTGHTRRPPAQEVDK
jgi:hypothetical protein